jgi:ribosomal protein S17E
VAGRWSSPGNPISPTNKIDRQDNLNIIIDCQDNLNIIERDVKHHNHNHKLILQQISKRYTNILSKRYTNILSKRYTNILFKRYTNILYKRYTNILSKRYTNILSKRYTNILSKHHNHNHKLILQQIYNDIQNPHVLMITSHTSNVCS